MVFREITGPHKKAYFRRGQDKSLSAVLKHKFYVELLNLLYKLSFFKLIHPLLVVTLDLISSQSDHHSLYLQTYAMNAL